jgi:hypothetical protein
MGNLAWIICKNVMIMLQYIFFKHLHYIFCKALSLFIIALLFSFKALSLFIIALLFFFKALSLFIFFQSAFIIFQSAFIIFQALYSIFLSASKRLFFILDASQRLFFILLSMKQCPIFVSKH